MLEARKFSDPRSPMAPCSATATMRPWCIPQRGPRTTTGGKPARWRRCSKCSSLIDFTPHRDQLVRANATYK
jgi:hypothetical protein